jgi:hypothetical protein
MAAGGAHAARLKTNEEEEEHESEEDESLAGPAKSILVALDLLGQRPTQSDLDMEQQF